MGPTTTCCKVKNKSDSKYDIEIERQPRKSARKLHSGLIKISDKAFDNHNQVD